MSDAPLAALRDVRKTYFMGAVQVDALRGVDIAFHRGEYVSIMGPSGCGKSTLLNVLGCLDRPSAGAYFLDGEDVAGLTDDDLSEIRGGRLGFVFQSYNLIQQLSVLENIVVPLYYQGVSERRAHAIGAELAERVGLSDRLRHRPFELSGGQQQRVAIARALVNDPLLILADEPTGNLDSKSGAEIMQLFDDLHGQGKTIIMVTHDASIGARSDRTVRLRDGVVEEDTRNERVA
ncbi:MAG TPA: ABC transporter ATP-binding protein [Candidatus Hydrogenedentes bacterium]|nr:ABC transporter ATP-binding protein [Candidatus Hydrogenedentota bacterium]HNT87113.1 ABC transporter ATP-binding protein [Candidatus Hydrogenedentota bacterium]